FQKYHTTIVLLSLVGLLLVGCNHNSKNNKLLADRELQKLKIERIKQLGGDDILFGRLRDLVILSDSVIVVSDLGKTTIEQFNLQGEHRATVANKGRGPGELPSFFNLIRTNNDTLIVRHGGGNRID